MIQHMRERLASSTARWWLSAAAVLGAGLLPCPECGTPLIFHFWPVAVLLLFIRALKRRARLSQPPAGSQEDPKGEAK